jgi:hypothetical protein
MAVHHVQYSIKQQAIRLQQIFPEPHWIMMDKAYEDMYSS